MLDTIFGNDSIPDKKMGINGIKLQKELCGECCYALEDMFDVTDTARTQKLMKTIDKINAKMGSHCTGYAATGLSRTPHWQTCFNYRSPAYTTDWNQLLTV